MLHTRWCSILQMTNDTVFAANKIQSYIVQQSNDIWQMSNPWLAIAPGITVVNIPQIKTILFFVLPLGNFFLLASLQAGFSACWLEHVIARFLLNAFIARTTFVEFTHDDLLMASQAWNDILMMDPRVQIGGFAFIMDLGGITIKDVRHMENPNSSKLAARYFQVSVSIQSNHSNSNWEKPRPYALRRQCLVIFDSC